MLAERVILAERVMLAERVILATVVRLDSPVSRCCYLYHLVLAVCRDF